MKSQNILLISMIMLITASIHGRDPIPMNAKFNIGQDIITSADYGLVNLDNGYLLKQKSETDIGLNCSLSYGINRFFGITFTTPFYLKHTIDSFVSRGLSDISTIIQFHLYRSNDHLLVLKTGMQFPTGDTNTRPQLGSGSFNPLLSLEAFHSSDSLFASAIFGANIATPRKHKKSETTLDYEITIGPKFAMNHDTYFYMFLELQGLYTFASSIHGNKIPNTGGHLILFGPILSYDVHEYQYLIRMQFPIHHKRQGSQPRANCLISLGFQRDL